MVPGNIPSLQQKCSWECEVLRDTGLCESKRGSKACITPSQHSVQMANHRPPCWDVPQQLHSSSRPSCWTECRCLPLVRGMKLRDRARGVSEHCLPASESIRAPRKAGPMLQTTLGWVGWEHSYRPVFPLGSGRDCCWVPCLGSHPLLWSLTFLASLLH